MTNIGRIAAFLSMDTKGWQGGLSDARRGLASAAKQMSADASRMAVGVSAAFLAAGSAAAAYSRQFEAATNKTANLTQLGRRQADNLAAAFIRLGPAVGRGATALNQAGFAAAFAGIKDGATAIDVVTESARASVAGLGDTAAIAGLAGAAVAAYGEENLTAAQATDTLLATVRTGSVDFGTLRGSVTRVTGEAASMGVTFAETNALIATFTRQQRTASQAVTFLRKVLKSAEAPSESAAKALAEAGLGADSLRRAIVSEGLGGGIEFIASALDHNSSALDTVIPGYREYRSVLAGAGDDGRSLSSTLGEIESQAGATETGFREASEGSAFALDQMKAAGESAALSLSSALSPAFSATAQAAVPFINTAAVLAQAFAALPRPVHLATVAVGGLFLALGPLGGALAGLKLVSAGVLPILSTFGISIGKASLAAIGLTAGTVTLANVMKNMDSKTSALAPKIQEVERRVGDLKKISEETKEPVSKLVEEIADGVTRADLWAKALANVNAQFKILADPKPLPGLPPSPTPGPPTSTPQPSGTPTPPPSTPGRQASGPTPFVTPSPSPTPTPLQSGADQLRPERDRRAREEFDRLEQETKAGASAAGSGGKPPPPKPGSGPAPEGLAVGDIKGGLAAIEQQAATIGPSFDEAGAKIAFLESKLGDAAEAGLGPFSSSVRLMQTELDKARRDTTGMETDIASMAARAGEPGFDVMEAQIARVTDEMDRMRADGISETDPALEALRSRIEGIAATAPGTVSSLKQISAEAEALGKNSGAEKIAFLNQRVATLAKIGGGATKGIRSLHQEIARAGLELGPTSLEMEIAAGNAGLFGDRQAELQARLSGARTALTETNSAFITAKENLGENADETQALRDRVAELTAEYKALSGELGKVQVSEGLANVEQQQGTGTGFSLSALAGQGRQGPSPLETVQGDIAVQQQGLATEQAKPEGLQDPSAIAAFEENIAAAQQYEAALLGVQGVAQSVAGAVGSAFQTSAMGIIQGTLTVEQAFANMGINILISWGATLAEMLAMELANQAIRLATEEGFLSAKLGLQTLFGQLEVANQAVVEGEKTGITLGGIAARIVGYGAELVAGLVTAGGIATGFVGSALATAASWVITFGIMAGGFIATAAVGIAEAIGLAFAWIAPAAVAAFTALASIPVVGPFLAFAAVAAVIGGLTALVLSFAAGGAELKEDQLVFAHKRELIIPADIAGGLTSMIRSGRAPGMRDESGEVGELRTVGSVAPSTAFQAMQTTRGFQTSSRRVPDIDEAGGRGGVSVTGPLIQPQIGAIDGASVEDVFRRERETLVAEAVEELRLRLGEVF